MEEWREISDCPGYEVSNTGKVRNTNYHRQGKTKLIATTVDEGGYVLVHMSVGGRSISRRVHRLVAETFIQNPFRKAQVNHIDGNKKNNGVENLEWSSPKENSEHASRTGLVDGRTTSQSKPIIVVSPDGFEKEYPSLCEAARRLNLVQGNISYCLQGKRKQHKGYRFRMKEDE